MTLCFLLNLPLHYPPPPKETTDHGEQRECFHFSKSSCVLCKSSLFEQKKKKNSSHKQLFVFFLVEVYVKNGILLLVHCIDSIETAKFDKNLGLTGLYEDDVKALH